MKRKCVWILILCLLLSGCAKAPEGEAADRISAEDALQLIEKEKAVQAVDVRTKQEYENGHIPGAILLSEKEAADAEQYLPLKDTALIVYGDAEHSSAEVTRILAGLGYTNLHDLGDFSQWTGDTQKGAWQGIGDKDGTLASFWSADIYGRAVDEACVAQNRLTMVNIWGTFCGPCIVEMPHLAELSDAFAERGVGFLGIVIDAPEAKGGYSAKVLEQARAIVHTTGADYPQILPTQVIVDLGLADVMYVPTTVFVDGQGRQVGDPLVGSRSKEEWEQVIEEYLAMVEHD